MGKPVKRLAGPKTKGLHRSGGGSISSGVLLLDGWLKHAKAARVVVAVVVLLATLLGACAKELWPAYQLSEGIVFETQHSIAEFAERQKAHRNCQPVTEVGVLSASSDEQNGVAEQTQGGFCESTLSRSTAHPGSVANGYQLWMRGKTRALPASNAGEGVGGEDL